MKAFRFEVAFSFAGAHREQVRAIAELVSAALDPGLTDRGKGRVFFDEWFAHEILGDDMDVLLQRFYHQQSRMVVADLSDDYAGRPWCQAEARAIRALRFDIDPARDETGRLRLLNLKLDEGDVPGVFKTTGYLDGIQNSAPKCAELILQRHALLVERMTATDAAEAMVGRGVLTPPPATRTPPSPGGALATARPTNASHSGPTPEAPRARSWVWHSTLATRAAGQVSVLACVETLFAVALYWWIAVRYDTHWHLVSSVFVAPLLLLRSPESIKAGVAWFLKDWVNVTRYSTWPENRKMFWIGGVILVIGFQTHFFVRWLCNYWLTGVSQGSVFIRTAIIEFLAATMSTAIAISGIGFERGSERIVAVARITGAFAGVFAIAISAGIAPGFLCLLFGYVLSGGGIGTIRDLFRDIGFGMAMGIGTIIRAFFCRLAATSAYTARGLQQLPANWREISVLTDSFISPEVIPGIRDTRPAMAFEGLRREFETEQAKEKWVIHPIVGAFFFTPAFLYRLNLKATAWFWWPLAYLLKPAPVADAEGQQKQALCWPWTNPFQKLWIIVSVLLVLVSLTLHHLDLAAWFALKNVPALPLALKVSLAIDWSHLAPWHWAQWVIAGAGAAMLALAGNARSHDVNGNWQSYRQRCPQHIRLMTGLQRLRTLATIALLLMALGALLLQDQTWQKHVSVPTSWIAAMRQFYRN